MHTYLFYDLETTGLNCAFDQVLQFAAIRTDQEFNEIKRYEIMVKLRPDVIPSPSAMISHCISIEKSLSGMCEYEATREIHSLLNEPDTISLGYNTLGFDDEFLRFSFHRNLLPPYTHQYANSCGRMDLLPIVTIYWLYKSEILEWPQVDGKISLKLEHLKEANNLTEGSSHDALTDVEASVELARRLYQEQEMWSYLADYFKKGIDMNRLQKLRPISTSLHDRYKFGLLINVGYGSEQNFQVPVLFLGYSEAYSNQSLWLRLDRPELQETTPDNIAETSWVIRKKYGEPGIILPPYERFLGRVDGERSQILKENKKWLQENPQLLQKISQYHCNFKYPEIADVDADAILYQMDFLTDREQEMCRHFHEVSFSEKVKMIDAFERPEIRELCRRIIFRNFPDRLPDPLTKEFNNFTYKINPVFAEEALLDYKGEKRMLPMPALEQIRTLKKSELLNTEQRTLLDELDRYIRVHFTVH